MALQPKPTPKTILLVENEPLLLKYLRTMRVGDADRTILRVEIRDLLTSINASQSKRAPQKDKLAITAPWPPRVAEARFLSRFRELCRKV